MVKLDNTTEGTMSYTRIAVKEEDIVKLILEFLRSRNLLVSMRTLEKESGVVNCEYSDEMLFLRELILDGDWDEVLLFAKPFEGLKCFDENKFRYIIYRQKFLEMLSLKSHVVNKQMTESIEEVIRTLGLLEKCCPNKEEYSNLCWLLTVPDLHERTEFKNWSLDNSRMNSFDKVVEMLNEILPMRKKLKRHNKTLASRDRLLQLLIKGLFYESCVDYCQAVAIGNNELTTNELMIKNDLISGVPEDYSANLLSWIRSLGTNSFGIPFEQVAVEISLEKHGRPSQVTQSLDVPRGPKKKNVDVETVFRSLIADTNISDTTNFSDRNRGVRAFELAEERQTKGSHHLPDEHLAMLTQNLPSQSSSIQKLGPIKTKVKEEKSALTLHNSCYGDSVLHHSDNTKNEKTFTKGKLSTVDSTNFQTGKTVQKNMVDVSENLTYNGDARKSSEFGFYNSNIESGEVIVKDIKEKQRLDVTRKLEKYERERKMMERELHGLNDNFTTQVEDGGGYLSPNLHLQGNNGSPPEEGFAADTPVQSSSTAHHNMKDDYYDSLKRPRKGSKSLPKTIENTAVKKETLVNEQGSQTKKTSNTPHLTSTPKAIPKTPKEMSNLQFSPVAHQLNNTKDTRPKRLPTKEKLTPSMSKEDQKMAPNGKQAQPKHSGAVEDGKENEPSPIATHENQGKGRKGPMINGVRRTLASNPALPSITRPPEDQNEEQNIVADTCNGVKTNESTRRNPDEKMGVGKGKTTELSRNIKGTGPTIRVKDGTKISVTELLKSRDEVKNATVVISKAGSVEENESRVEEICVQEEPSTEELPLTFNPVCKLEDMQAVRAVAFHPKGNIFAVGSNSKTLRVCSAMDDDFAECERGGLPTPVVLFKRTKYHRGSIYCIAWNPDGNVIATGSNDKTIKVMRFNTDNCIQEGIETEFTIHNGTVRELAFVPSKPSIFISGGVGDGGIPITDCQTNQTIGHLQGHSGTVMAVYAGEGDLVATGAADNTLRLWDLRSQRCIDVVMVGDSSPASVALSDNGSYMATGQEDGCILLYDITAGRTLQSFRLHQEDCRSVRFSPDSRYLLTGSYDSTINLLHTEKNLDRAVPKHYTIGNHKDKVIQCRWHPWERSFLSSSADRTVMLWREKTADR